MFLLGDLNKKNLSEISVDEFINGWVFRHDFYISEDCCTDATTIQFTKEEVLANNPKETVSMSIRSLIKSPSEIIVIQGNDIERLYYYKPNFDVAVHTVFYIDHVDIESSNLKHFVELREYIISNPKTTVGKNEYLDYLNSGDKDNMPFRLWIEIMKDTYGKI